MKILHTVLAVLLAAVLAGCPAQMPNSQNNTDGASFDLQSTAGADLSTYGKIKIVGKVGQLGDGTIAHAVITVTAIDIRNVAGGFVHLPQDPYDLDLMSLATGATPLMGRARVPDGQYDLIRLHTTAQGTVTMSDGTQYPLKVPSGPQSGLKVFLDSPVTVSHEEITAVNVEFDLSQSFVMPNNGFIFKPVVHCAVTQYTDPSPDGGTEVVDNGSGGGSTDTSGGTTDTSGGGTTDTSGGTGGTTDTSGGTSSSGGTTDTSGGSTGGDTIFYPVGGLGV